MIYPNLKKGAICADKFPPLGQDSTVLLYRPWLDFYNEHPMARERERERERDG
jgi:hypothetical protein